MKTVYNLTQITIYCVRILHSGGDAGTLRIAVTGRDDRGHRESLTRVLLLH